MRGYPVREVSRRLGVSTYSLYKWVKLFGEPSPKPGVDQEAENGRLKRELARVTEERDILKNRSGPQPACARYKQLVLCCARRAVADGLLVDWTPLKNVAHGPMRT